MTSQRQNTSTHISDHIHEWRRRRRLIKAQIPDQVLANWFVKSLLPTIAKDVALSGAATEEEVIMRAEHLYLISSQYGVIYEILPNAPRSFPDTTKTIPGPHAHGVIGSAANISTSQVVNQLGQMSLSSNTMVASQNTMTPANPTQTSEINSIQNIHLKGNKQPGGKKKGKNKANKQGGENNNQAVDKKKRKFQYPCMLCQEEHLTKDCLYMEEATKFVAQKEAAKQPVVLTNPFRPQGQQMVASASNNPVPLQGGNQGPSSQGGNATTANIFMCEQDVHIQTKAHTYDAPDPGSKGKEKVTPESNGPLHIENPTLEIVTCPPKGAMKITIHNPNVRAAQNYIIVEDLAQAPCAMSVL